MSNSYERCVLHVKSKGTAYNPWAVCATTVGRYGGRPTPHQVSVHQQGSRRIYEGPRGGWFYVVKGKKYYIKNE